MFKTTLKPIPLVQLHLLKKISLVHTLANALGKNCVPVLGDKTPTLRSRWRAPVFIAATFLRARTTTRISFSQGSVMKRTFLVYIRFKSLPIHIKGSAENIGQMNRKFSIVGFGIFWRFLHQWTENIPNIVWVCNKAFWIENYGSQAFLNSILEFKEEGFLIFNHLNWLV